MRNTLQRLTISIAILAILASSGGLLIPNLYRDNAFYKAAWQGNDLITLLLTPALLASHYYYKRGNANAQLLWLGLLLYMFYNFAFYLFGAAFNWFFLIYAATFALCLYALLIGLREIDRSPAHRRYLKPLARKVTIAFFCLVALPLAAVELAQCWRFIMSGIPPDIPELILALDLTLVIPNTMLAALLLVRKRRWGTILSAMMLVKSFTYGLVLVTGTTFVAITGVGAWDPLLPYYIFVSAGGLVLLLTLFMNLENSTT